MPIPALFMFLAAALTFGTIIFGQSYIEKKSYLSRGEKQLFEVITWIALIRSLFFTDTQMPQVLVWIAGSMLLWVAIVVVIRLVNKLMRHDK